MEVVNRISEGLHLDNNEYDQPVNTMRDNRNGLIYDTNSGRYLWRGLNGTTSVLQLNPNDKFMGYVNIRSRHFIITLNTLANSVRIIELKFALDETISQVIDIWTTTNDILNLNPGYPIRSIFGIYENDDVIRFYFTDYHNQPRVINLAGNAPISINEKFIDFTPVLQNGYGKFKLISELTGGSLKAGVYFFVWRLYKDGYYTDWSYFSSPVSISNGFPGNSYGSYHEIHGNAPNEFTNKGIKFEIIDIDIDYDTIQIASFYSNDLNSIASGAIIYERKITGTSIEIDYYGGEEANTVTVSEASETSLFIARCKDMVSTGKYNVISNIEERSELDIKMLNSQQKDNKIDVNITPLQYNIILDTKTYETVLNQSLNPLNGILTGELELSSIGVIPGIYHYAETDVSYTDPITTHNIPAGRIFRPTIFSILNSGTARLMTVIKKYRKSSGSYPYDINSDYALETRIINNEYYNYKNPYFANKLKGYPAGEKIRLGILFLDKTGKPYFVRHLNNTLTTYDGITIGPGDTRIPERYENSNYKLTQGITISETQDSRKDITYGAVNYLSVSGINITPIKDKIGAFMIVRCPIERENIAYGALGFVYQNGNDLYANFSFRAHSNDVGKKQGIYVFYSPEDMFDLNGFSIQPGDKLVNRYYMTPFDPSRSEGTGLQGYGMRMNPYIYEIDLYQKFYIWHDSNDTGNAAINAEHNILYYTKYRQGDGDEITVDPRNPSLALRYRNSITINGSTYNSYITNLGITVLDINDTAQNVKGVYNLATSDPRMLICSVKRPRPVVYGGLNDSALASSIYISTGHYQEINDSVLADIEIAGHYIFNEIDIFGGDTFVCIWDFLRLQANKDIDSNNQRYSHSILMPIETRINLELRDGNHVGKNRISTSNGDGGLNWETGSNKWEEFKYNDGYSSDDPGRYYLPVPMNFTSQSNFDTDIRFSDPKEYGEYSDSFRKFKPLNKYQLDKKFGPITNIRHKFNNLIYWQTECVGYIPIGERALTSNDLGRVIQLGVAGIFERNDQLVEFVGNSNQFGLIESNNGFHWYDAIKKLFVSITNSLQITPDSIVQGLDSYFINKVPSIISTYDYPASGWGISGGFDPKEKIVYISFRVSDFIETIGLSIKDNRFTGFYDFDPGIYFNANNSLYATNFYNESIHHFGSGNIGNYFGVNYNRYFTIIVKEDSNIDKIFDNYQIIGNDEFFTFIKYELEDQSSITEYYRGPMAKLVSQKLKYRNRRWFGNFPKLVTERLVGYFGLFPKIQHERLVGGYCKITFVNTDTADAKFLQMLTKFRQMI